MLNRYVRIRILMRLLRYLNPIEHLGEKKYSFIFPFITNLSICLLSEVYSYKMVKNPMAVGAYIIFVNVALIIYFSFRSGIIGGLTATVITVFYYVYIIFTRHYQGTMLYSGLLTTAILFVLYASISFTIGWLKQIIDSLIEREANEKNRLRSVVQQLPVGIVIADKKGKIEITNRKLDTILGQKRHGHSGMGSTLIAAEVQSNGSVSNAQSPLSLALTTGKPVTDKEFIITRPDKKVVYLRVSAAPIRSRRGDTIAAASIIDDITQQKEIEKRKDDFVNIASHELKTPLTSMKIYIESLRRRVQELNDDQAHKILQRIQIQTDKLQELVNDLLDVSRIQTGKLQFTKDEFVLNDLISEIVEGFAESEKKQVIVYSGKTPIRVLADRFRIYQVVTNLLTNAIKYSPPGSAIRIVTKRQDNRAIVSVADSGIGIAKEQQKKIFDRLYQVTEPKEKTFPGLGIGLYISKEIVKRHRGSIWVESQKGKGSTFYFSLPLQKEY